MGKLIATTQATVDGVVDPVAEWVQPDGDHGEYSFERQARSSGLVAIVPSVNEPSWLSMAYWPQSSHLLSQSASCVGRTLERGRCSRRSSNAVTAPCPEQLAPIVDRAV